MEATGARRAAALATGVALLFTGACDTDKGGGRADDKAPTATLPVTSPTATAPVPRGRGSKVADDVNGDGYPDFAYSAECGAYEPARAYRKSCLVVLYGSAHGLDPAVHTLLEPGDAALPKYVDAHPTWNPSLVDLDGDGYADIKYGAFVVWGGPTGPRPDTPDSTLPDGTTGPGDFDGDGHPDLAAASDPFRILYGPFDRKARPSRTDPDGLAPITGSFAEGEGGLSAGDADGDDKTDLVASARGYNGEPTLVLLHTGPAGSDAPAQRLRSGSSLAFGDFDGDGKGDIAVGHNGNRSDDEDDVDETEAPAVHDTLTVYPGDGGTPHQLKDVLGYFITGDLDGDGCDELLVNPHTGPDITVLHGSPGGLGSRSILRRTGPSRVPGTKRAVASYNRYAIVSTVRDFDGDGHAEAVLRWSLPSGDGPSQWWIVEDGKDVRAFTDQPFTDASVT
ncbi:FG-GAP repeat domain-containing protein [Streptomyces aurantiacus]|nr:VCBS repeat-containing protein [Streptomyces aurantiacus]